MYHFLFHIAFSITLLTLISAVILYTWSVRNEGPGSVISKIIALVALIFSTLGLLCMIYYGIQYWKEGYFQSPYLLCKCSMSGDEKSGMHSMMNQSGHSGSPMKKNH